MCSLTRLFNFLSSPNRVQQYTTAFGTEFAYLKSSCTAGGFQWPCKLPSSRSNQSFICSSASAAAAATSAATVALSSSSSDCCSSVSVQFSSGEPLSQTTTTRRDDKEDTGSILHVSLPCLIRIVQLN